MKKQFAVFGLGSFGESIALELQKSRMRGRSSR